MDGVFTRISAPPADPLSSRAAPGCSKPRTRRRPERLQLRRMSQDQSGPLRTTSSTALVLSRKRRLVPAPPQPVLTTFHLPALASAHRSFARLTPCEYQFPGFVA